MSVRSRVLSSFKALHRTRLKLFNGDCHALSVSGDYRKTRKFVRDKINTEYRKNIEETETDKLNKLLQMAVDSEKLLRTSVLQGVIGEDNVMKVRVTKDTYLEDNSKFNPLVRMTEQNRKSKRSDKPS